MFTRCSHGEVASLMPLLMADRLAHLMDSTFQREPLIGCNRCPACKPNDVGEQSGTQYFLHHRRRCRRDRRAFACRPSLKLAS
jgi:hypothetical protein